MQEGLRGMQVIIFRCANFFLVVGKPCSNCRPYMTPNKKHNPPKMKKLLTLAFAALTMTTAAVAQKPVTVGGAPMYATKNIIENAVNSKDHTTLVAAVKAGGLVDALSSAGPFTVFAPTNRAFDKLPAGTVDGLLKPEALSSLQGILKYHVVSGSWDAKSLKKMIQKGRGKAQLKTLAGGTLTAVMDKKGIWIIDANGGKSRVTQSDVRQSNGVIHVVDAVLLPKG
jgi:uncharacterized surface protein with fasciclin (FAS1) repeats